MFYQSASVSDLKVHGGVRFVRSLLIIYVRVIRRPNQHTNTCNLLVYLFVCNIDAEAKFIKSSILPLYRYNAFRYDFSFANKKRMGDTLLNMNPSNGL